MPTYADLYWPTLAALKNKGGSASNRELSEQIAIEMAIPDHVSDTPHLNGTQTELDYRLAWARTHLKWIGAIENTGHGVWTITPAGREIASDEEVRDRVRKEQRRRARRQPARTKSEEPPHDVPKRAEGPAESDWRDELLAILTSMSPSAFERLCQRILRESDFTRVEVTGRAGDGGIDGAGVLRVNLISFHVRFQCKRYTGSVGAREIRDFRGAMVGRADKGLFLTTGRFTRAAAAEATRDGAPAIDLVDGRELCRILRKLQLGVTTEVVKVVRLQPKFFEEL